MSNEKILARIQALIEAAEGRGRSEEESQAFADKAQKLMIQHAVEEAQLNARFDKHKNEKPIMRAICHSGHASGWDGKNCLLRAIAETNNCVVNTYIFANGRKIQTHYSVDLIGYKSDVEMVELLYSSLLLQMIGHIDKAWRAEIKRRQERENKVAKKYGDRPYTASRAGSAAFRKSFYDGFSGKIRRRLEKTNKEYVHEGNGKELMLTRRNEVAEWVAEQSKGGEPQKPDKRPVKSFGYDELGYRAGRESADQVDVGNAGIKTHRMEIEV